jgi:hypothetical protein
MSLQLIGFCHFHFLAWLRGRLIKIGRDAKKTIAIATAYPIRSLAIDISKCLSSTWQDAAGMGRKL